MNNDLMRAAALGDFIHDIEHMDHRALILLCDRLINYARSLPKCRANGDQCTGGWTA